MSELFKLGWNMYFNCNSTPSITYFSSCNCPTKHEFVNVYGLYGTETYKVIKRTRAIWMFGMKIK